MRVSVGDEVKRGDRLGACGNPGSSTEPHLHYQLQDHPNFFLATGLPPTFTDFARERDGEHVESGYVTAPETVTPKTRGDAPSAPSTEASRT